MVESGPRVKIAVDLGTNCQGVVIVMANDVVSISALTAKRDSDK